MSALARVTIGWEDGATDWPWWWAWASEWNGACARGSGASGEAKICCVEDIWSVETYIGSGKESEQRWHACDWDREGGLDGGIMGNGAVNNDGSWACMSSLKLDKSKDVRGCEVELGIKGKLSSSNLAWCVT